MPFTSSQSTAQATGCRAEVSAPARVVLLDNRDSFVYNLVDQFATLGSQIEVYRNNVPASRVLAALEPTEAERQAGRRPVLCLSPGPGYPATSGCLMELVATALDEAIPTLGICLGFQALVEACGGRVARSARSTAAPTASRSLRRDALTRPSRCSTAVRWMWPATTPWARGHFLRHLSALPGLPRQMRTQAVASSWRPGTGRCPRSGCSSTPSRSSPRRARPCSRPSPLAWPGPSEPRHRPGVAQMPASKQPFGQNHPRAPHKPQPPAKELQTDESDQQRGHGAGGARAAARSGAGTAPEPRAGLRGLRGPGRRRAVRGGDGGAAGGAARPR